jgi:hypothetical protein
VAHLDYYFLATGASPIFLAEYAIISFLPPLLFLCHVYSYCRCFWLGSCSDGYFYMKQPYVGAAASISAASNQPVCDVWRVPCANNIKQS